MPLIRGHFESSASRYLQARSTSSKSRIEVELGEVRVRGKLDQRGTIAASGSAERVRGVVSGGPVREIRRTELPRCRHSPFGPVSAPLLETRAHARDPLHATAFRARGAFAVLPHPEAAGLPTYQPVVRERDWPPAASLAAPTLGADNDYVFGELLGLTAQEVQRLQSDGVIS